MRILQALSDVLTYRALWVQAGGLLLGSLGS